MPDPIKIQREKLLLAEGEDAKYFFWYLLSALGIENIDVHDYRGIKDLTKYIDTLQKLDNYNTVKTILVARDAEKSAISAVQSVNTSLKANGIITTEIKPFEIAAQTIKTGIMIFPGIDENGGVIEAGTLENLCLKIFKEQTIVEQTEGYISDYQKKENRFKHPHKNKLHAALSFSDIFVGMKIGETTKAGGFDFESVYLRPFLDVLRAL
ncbi:hypothetical protein LQZ19_09860 [Treponema primitia]|uniref:DUF3226 domain-containing protein n=1 Tax=Treponema primitia TaxID=88058 RepID=UPI0039818290